MEKVKYLIVLIVFLFFVVACNKSTSPEHKKVISGKIIFYNSEGAEIDSVYSAAVKLYPVETFADTVKNFTNDYSNVFSSLNPKLITDFRLLSPISEQETDNNQFTFTNLDLNEYILVYSAPNFGWHYRLVNYTDDNLVLKMRKSITVQGVLDNEVTWGPDEYVYIPENLYCFGKLTIFENTVISLGTNVKLSIDADIETNGKSNEPVLFTSNNDLPQKGDWNQIEITANSQNSGFAYTILRWSNLGIQNFGKIQFENSSILSSWSGITLYGSYAEIKNSLFYDFQKAIYIISTDSLANQPNIENSILIGSSEYAIQLNGSSPTIRNDIFYDNFVDIRCVTEGSHAHYGTSPYIINCLFKNSHDKNIYSNRAAADISYCLFEGNSQNVIPCNCVNTTNTTINYCNFIDNDSIYLIKLYYRSGGSDVDATNNWWGTSSEEDIQNLIYDENDEMGGNDIGYVHYSPWKTSKIYNAGPQ